MPKETKIIKFWVMPNAGFFTKPVLEKELQRFKYLFPHLQVEITVISWSKAWQRLVRTMKRPEIQDTPDVIQIGSTWQGTLSYLGWLGNLNDRIDKLLLDDFIDPLLKSCYAENQKQLYALPWFSDVRVLYYRKDVLKKLGVDAAELSHWEGLRQVLQLVKERMAEKIQPMSLSGQSEEILMHDLAPWIWSAQGDFMDLNSKKCAFSQEASFNAIHFFLSLIHEGHIPILGRDRVTYGNFFNGESAFQVSGAWPVQTLFNPHSKDYNKTVAKNFNIAPFPSCWQNQPSTTYIGGSHLAMLSSSRNQDEAWSLIQFLTDKQNQESHARKVGVLPARKSSFQGKYFEKNWSHAGLVFAQAVASSKTFPALPVLGTIEQLVKNFTQDILESIRIGVYQKKILSQQIEKVSSEMDYILSLYS